MCLDATLLRVVNRHVGTPALKGQRARAAERPSAACCINNYSACCAGHGSHTNSSICNTFILKHTCNSSASLKSVPRNTTPHFRTQALLLTRLRQEYNSSNYSNSWYLQLARLCSGDEIMNELGGAGNVNRGPLWRKVKERAHLKNLGVDGRIILNRSSGNTIGMRGLNWSGSGQGQCQALEEVVNRLPI